MSGGRWKRAPVNVDRADSNACEEASAEWKRITQTYSLPVNEIISTMFGSKINHFEWIRFVSNELLGGKVKCSPAPC
jgi:hypothetical protein